VGPHLGDHPHRTTAQLKRVLGRTCHDSILSNDRVSTESGTVHRASPAMISSYFAYMTTEYATYAGGHGMLLIQLAGPQHGEPWTTDAARGMLRRAGRRAGLPGRIKPHSFRHTATAKVLDASGNDPMVAKVVGNWASTRMVDEVYGHPDMHSPKFQAALTAVWGEQA
ncbi:tyrosine-type recombinase/integrase, partial [Streptomyces aureus]